MSRIIKFLKKYNIIIASLIIMLALFLWPLGIQQKMFSVYVSALYIFLLAVIYFLYNWFLLKYKTWE